MVKMLAFVLEYVKKKKYVEKGKLLVTTFYLLSFIFLFKSLPPLRLLKLGNFLEGYAFI